ncbi:response regulator [Streptomyces sp. NPDC059015]|uniref:response regulator n=1 Tax=unclassified Streptomyces TaxID=2593676 RepID=UPI00368D5A40
MIVDDEILMREGVRRVLDTFRGVRVVAVCAGAQAAGEVERWQPDLVLLDVRMPHRDGRKTLAELCLLNRPPVVAVLTASAAEENLSAALRAGAAGFLLKDTAPEQLEYAIRELARGNAVIDPRMARTVIRGYVNRGSGRSPSAGSESARLVQIPAGPRTRADWAAKTWRAEAEEFTAREREVLELLTEGLSNTEIAKELHIGPTTVKDHVSALLGKLGVANRVQAAVQAHQRGLVSGAAAGMRRTA